MRVRIGLVPTLLIGLAMAMVVGFATAFPVNAASPSAKGKVAAAEQPAFLDNLTPTASAPWTGPWIGVNLGYAVQTSRVEGEDGGFVSTPFSLDSAADGVTYGASTGFNLQVGSVVLGVFADYDWTNAKNKFSIPTSPGPLVGDIDIKSMWAVGGRAGYLVTPHVLAYGLAGYTKVNWSVPTNADTGSVNDAGGLTVGGGLEAMASSGWSAKLEYRFVDLGNDTLTYNVPGPIDAVVKADHNLHLVRLGATYRFGAK